MADDSLDTQPDRKRLRLAPIIAGAAALILGCLFWLLLTAEANFNETAQTPLLDAPAPNATGTYADGSPFELSRRKGSWVVLNFFTSNCAPCQREHPALFEFAATQQALGNDGAELYTIVQHDDATQVDAFFAENGGDWPIVYDTRFEFQNDFGVAQVPETWIIDPDGIVRGRIISEVTAEFLSGTLQTMRGTSP